MVEYTVVLLYDWDIHKSEIRKMFQENEMYWNSTKIKSLTNEELVNEYKRFKVDNNFKLDTTMIGSSGIYENKDKNSSIAIKLIKIEDVDNMLIVYKGIKEKFYKQLMIKFRDIGCLIMKIVDDEVVFKNRINIKMINMLNNIQEEKNVKIRNFIEKTNINITLGIGTFSDDFKQQWIECIINN